MPVMPVVKGWIDWIHRLCILKSQKKYYCPLNSNNTIFKNLSTIVVNNLLTVLMN